MEYVPDRSINPPESEPTVVGECAYCGEDITIGEDYYDIEGEIVCESHLHEWAQKYHVRV